MLIDTSAWAEYFKPVPEKSADSGVNLAIKRTIDTYILNNQLIYTCPTIVQEVLQGAVNRKEQTKLISALQSTVLLSFEDQSAMAQQAAEVYQKCRTKGLTMRKSNDCLIATMPYTLIFPCYTKIGTFIILIRYSRLKLRQ